VSFITKNPHPRIRGGFTLIELMVVIAILAVLISVVAPNVFSNVADAKVTAARSQIESLSLALDSYRLDNGDYPTTEQGLQALRTPPSDLKVPSTWRGPYVRRDLPRDPWKRPYVYISPGRVNLTAFDLYTLGKDAASGGVGEDHDITSWGGTPVP
jgi:general secretion pathway protein G